VGHGAAHRHDRHHGRAGRATTPVNRVNFSALDGESFAAMMSLLNSHDKLLYNPISKVLFSAR
jgi:hypothetical protein